MSEQAITYEQLFDTLRREKSRDDLQKLDKDFYENVRTFLATKEDTIRAESAQGMSALAVQRATIEYHNVKKILKELYERRERKIITMALHRTRTDATVVDNDTLLPEERMYIEALVHLMLQNREQILSNVEMREPMIVTPMPQYARSERPVSSYAQAYAPSYEPSEEIRSRPEEAPAQEPPRFAVTSKAVEEAAGDTFTHVEEMVRVQFLAPVPKFVGKDLRVFGPYEQGSTGELPDDIAQILIKKGRAQELD